MMMIFAGESYYARGGFNDFIGAFLDVESAKLIVEDNAEGPPRAQWDWWHIIDSETLEVLAQSEAQAHGCGENSYCPGGGD